MSGINDNYFLSKLVGSVVTSAPNYARFLPGMVISFNSQYYYDTTGEIMPEGWAFCNGQNNTPDLRSRFILGQCDGEDTHAGLSHRAEGETGGDETHTLTTAELPAHNHTASTSTAGDHDHNIAGYGLLRYDGTGTAETTDNSGSEPNIVAGRQTMPTAGAHTHDVTVNNSGDGQAHSIMNPFYVLAYIMKL
jgi:microcystin-dependent protein